MRPWLSEYPHRSRIVAGLLIVAPLIVPGTPAQAGDTNDFSDGFEVQKLLDLLPRDRSRWTHYQSTFPQNKAEIVEAQPQSGKAALRLFAVPSTSKVSKSAIEKEDFELRSGRSLRLSAWFLIPPDIDIRNLFLFDIECRNCWPEDSPYPNQSPGIRLKLQDRDGAPTVERRKIGLKDMKNELAQRAALPRGRWFKLEWRVRLGDEESGESEILIDDKAVFQGQGATLPDPQAFMKWNIKLRDVLYDRFQVGITANSSPNPIEMLVDTVSFSAE